MLSAHTFAEFHRFAYNEAAKETLKMRKAIGIAVVAAFILSFSGCANTENPRTIENSAQETVSSGFAQRTEPEESSAASVSESKESSEQSTPAVKAETAQEEVSPPAAVESSKVEVQPTADENRLQKTEPPKTDTPEPVTSQPTTPSAENPAASEPPQETAPPITEEPTAPTFNIQTWIDFAVGYAESVGLNVSPDATACWDNPITAGSHSMYLERDIQSRLNRYSRDGEITDVWIWAEERSDGSYDLYIGYA